jgi:prepilin-type processing-associated H-X9-DG protein
MKQLGLGLNLSRSITTIYSPTAYSTGDYQYQLSWDDYIHRYIGGGAPEADLIVGISGGIADRSTIPKILKCPADTIQISISWATFGQRRTYAMNYAGPNFILSSPSTALPPATHGVGIYYNLRGSAAGHCLTGNREASRPAPCWMRRCLVARRTTEGGNIAGNDWPSFSQGPTGPSNGDQTPYQIAVGGRQQWGAKAYGLHGKRFNYLFFDGHAGIHKITDTVGSGTTNAPRGMWTMTLGD